MWIDLMLVVFLVLLIPAAAAVVLVWDISELRSQPWTKAWAGFEPVSEKGSEIVAAHGRNDGRA